ncbi:MAG TPA: pteridine reductase [Povalibacter sp.]|mgnify:CR=1 FL=1|uniref:pteridine reductase n=1 Tax=Povalibacter sp. TaxID=1962978 RepID=UPI002B86A10A|nr:pteridine reductase [Povalibacter sp.]HMN44627.1 pteridine reductase [Povalibacter sp.]
MITSDSLAGRVVLITGAAKRLGAALARGFHAAGASVAIHHHHSAGEAGRLRDEFNTSRKNSAIAMSADLLDTAQLPRLVEQTLAAFGRLDVLINNASTFYPTTVGSIELEDWDDLMGTNLKAPLFLSQAARPALRDAKGLILNMIDIHAQRPLRNHPVYCSAKAGLAMLTKSLARELGPDVRVNGIAPGPILWPEGGLDQKLQEEIVEKTLLKRRGGPDDIVRTALFFAVDAPYVTGQILAVDGGRSV